MSLSSPILVILWLKNKCIHKSTNNDVMWNPSHVCGDGVIAASHARKMDVCTARVLTCALPDLNTCYLHRICNAEVTINGRVPRTIKVFILQMGTFKILEGRIHSSIINTACKLILYKSKRRKLKEIKNPVCENRKLRFLTKRAETELTDRRRDSCKSEEYVYWEFNVFNSLVRESWTVEV